MMVKYETRKLTTFFANSPMDSDINCCHINCPWDNFNVCPSFISLHGVFGPLCFFTYSTCKVLLL